VRLDEIWKSRRERDVRRHKAPFRRGSDIHSVREGEKSGGMILGAEVEGGVKQAEVPKWDVGRREGGRGYRKVGLREKC